LDGSFVSGSIATSEGLDGRGPPAFAGCSPARSHGLNPCGDVHHDAALCVELASARETARCARALSMESSLFALSTASGESRSGREPQLGSIMVRHRWGLSNLTLAAK